MIGSFIGHAIGAPLSGEAAVALSGNALLAFAMRGGNAIATTAISGTALTAFMARVQSGFALSGVGSAAFQAAGGGGVIISGTAAVGFRLLGLVTVAATQTSDRRPLYQTGNASRRATRWKGRS